MSLYFQRWKPDDDSKAVLVLIHGFGEHSGRYGNVVEYLIPRKYGVYGFDHRGHGRSPGQRGHVADWSEFRGDVRAFLRLVAEQEPGRPLFLMGHSMGGLIVLDYALREPDGLSGVVASAPALTQTGTSPVLKVLARLFSRILPRFSMNVNLDVNALSRDPEVCRAYREDPLVHGRATARMGVEMMEAGEWALENAANLRIPLLIIHGEADRLVPIETSRLFFERVALPDKEFLALPGGYHESHNDIEKEQVLASLTMWLERHLPAAPAPAN